MTDLYKLGYNRGYNASSARRWPEHRPPKPPHKMSLVLFDALEDLTDAVDTELAAFDDDDNLVIALGPKVEKARHAMIAISKWLRECQND